MVNAGMRSMRAVSASSPFSSLNRLAHLQEVVVMHLECGIVIHEIGVELSLRGKKSQ